MSAQINFDAIPQELRDLPQWVLWTDNGRKLPCTISGKAASSTDPATWNDFDTVAERFSISSGFAGVGFVFAPDDPYVGIDLDGCRNPVTGEIADWALGWIDQLASYTEISPSKTGVKIFCRGKSPRDRGARADVDAPKISSKNPQVEIYDHARFFTTTGQHLPQTPATITVPGKVLDEFVATYWPAKTVTTYTTSTGPSRLDLVETCWKYVSKCDDATSGNGGHPKTYHAACECFRFGLTDSEAAEVMRRFNSLKTGDEPWNDRELQHKLTDARNEVVGKGEFGIRQRNDWRAPSGVVLDAIINTTASSSVAHGPIRPLTVRKLVTDYPNLRKAVVHGLLRQGETMNVIASPKMGKSWLVNDLALSVATGRPWMGFEVDPGPVLTLDNELHIETTANRIPKIANARGISIDEYGDRVHIANLRGHLTDIVSLGKLFDEFEKDAFKMIIIDAFYRALPAGMDENANTAMTGIYNLVDAYASKLNCCFVLIHHATKGNQSGKSVTDTGAGAGAQSRAADTHLVIRPHQDEGIAVMEAVTRSWPSPEPRCLRWSFPVWNPAEECDPAQLKQERPGRNANGTPEEQSKRGAARLREELQKAVTPLTNRQLRDLSGINSTRFDAAFQLIRNEVEAVEFKGRNKATYTGWVIKKIEPGQAGHAGQNDINPACPASERRYGTTPKGDCPASSSPRDGGEQEKPTGVPLLEFQKGVAEFNAGDKRDGQ